MYRAVMVRRNCGDHTINWPRMWRTHYSVVLRLQPDVCSSGSIVLRLIDTGPVFFCETPLSPSIESCGFGCGSSSACGHRIR